MASGTTIADMNVVLHFDGKALKGEMSSISKQSQTVGSNIASKVGGALKTVTKVAVGTATAITGAIGGIVAKGGFDRAMSIEQAEFKLKGLGHGAEEVDAIMDNALASVKGTAFGLGDAATVAASAVASGVKPGQDLQRTLSLVADASAIAGADMTEMGAIFNKVSANGKLSAEEMNQLADRGIPILQLLADTTGKTTEEVRSMVSAGEIGFADFQNAIEKGMGGAALTMGQTFSGAVENTKAALSRLGATLMGPLTQGLTPVMGELISLIDDVAAGTTDNINAKTAQIAKGLSDSILSFINGLAPILQTMVPVVVELLNSIAALLPTLIQQLLPVVLNAVVQLVLGLVNMLPSIMNTLVAAIPIVVNATVQLLQGLVQAIPLILPQLIAGIGELLITIVEQLTRPDFMTAVLDAALALLVSVVKALPQMITQLVNALPRVIDNIVKFLTNPSNIKKILQAAVQLFFALVKAVPQILGALLGAFGTLVGNLWNGITGMFGAFAGRFGTFIGGIFKGAINGVLGFIEGFINAPINLINGFIGAINEAFGFIGVNLGTINTIKLPRLAQGGIVDRATTAVIGEAGREAVIPLENNTGNWAGLLARTLADEMNTQGMEGNRPLTVNMTVEVNNEMDADDIGRKLMQSIRRYA